MRQKTCSACGGKMQSLGNMELQKGRFSMLFGNLRPDHCPVRWTWTSNAASAAKSSNSICWATRRTPETSGIEQIACPYCGDMHDMDDAICPTLRQTADGTVKNYLIIEGEITNGYL